jgi:oxalate decarboxylase
MLYGTARISAIDPTARVLLPMKKKIFGFSPAEPALDSGSQPDGCEFMLVFDDGEFS